jgi:hypothetical protein
MPFTIRSLRLPFVKISNSPKAGRSFTWHAGPWQYNSRTGQHTLKLPGTLTYTSRTRPQKKAAATQRATRKSTERAAWDAHFRGTAPTPTPTKKTKPTKKTTGKTTVKARMSGVTHGSSGAPGPSVRVTGGAGVGVSFADYMDTRLCRKPTAGGGICQNIASKCPPGTHAADAAPASLEDTRRARLQRWDKQTEDARATLRAMGYPIPGEESDTPAGGVIGQRVAVCGARTRDGSPCSNTGRCPHHGRQK